jgi:pyridoxal phosphate enzyme (YggS family)
MASEPPTSDEAQMIEAYQTVIGRVKAACARRPASISAEVGNVPRLPLPVVLDSGTSVQVRLVAVSKTKPLSAILALHAGTGHCHFGENYVAELLEKAAALPSPPPSDLAWHFIGHLQSNKVKSLVHGTPQLWVIESVDSIKLANVIEKAVATRPTTTATGTTAGGAGDSSVPLREPMRVFIQINTSGESQKGGVEMGEEAIELAKHIVSSCPHLLLMGVMTIGDPTAPPELAFRALAEQRKLICDAMGRPEASLELSMGMSGDFEAAIEHGSTNVRVGSSIFGAREYTPKVELK